MGNGHLFKKNLKKMFYVLLMEILKRIKVDLNLRIKF